MTDELIRERLLATIQKLKELPPSEFNYEEFIAQVNEPEYGEGCPTICCVAGWYPKWFPESPFIWHRSTQTGEIKLTVHHDKAFLVSRHYIQKYLMRWHGLSEPIIESLFIGKGFSLGEDLFFMPEGGLGSSLDQVIAHWEAVYELALTSDIKYLIPIQEQEDE